MTHPDQMTALVRQRQEDLRSLAAEISRGRQAREARAVQRRPLHLRLVTLLVGPN